MTVAKLRERALSLGAKALHRSTRKSKKYMVLFNNRWIHFGAAGMSDYTIHGDSERRRRYRARHRAIKLKNGRPAYKDKTSPSYWSWHLLW